MTDNAVSFLYILMALLLGTMGTVLCRDAWRNHYNHRPMKPVVVWISALFILQAVMFVGLGTARYYRAQTGTSAPWLFSPMWAVLLFMIATCVVGFYAALREAR